MAGRRGTILSAEDDGTIWQLTYQRDDDGLESVYFDHRPFAAFYEGVTGRDFFQDYRFGAGRGDVAEQLKGLRIQVEGKPLNETVRLDE